MSEFERTPMPAPMEPSPAWLPFPWRISAAGWLFLLSVILLAYAEPPLVGCFNDHCLGRSATVYLALFVPLFAFAPAIAAAICLASCLPLAALRRWSLAGHALAAAVLGASAWRILAAAWLDWSLQAEAERMMKMPL